MKRSYFKPKPRKPLKRTKLRVKGTSTTTQLRDEVQSYLRAIAIKRDKTCVMSKYPETGKCGGYRKDGELILQFDHLNSRTHASSFSDPRLGILVCQRHHIYYKRQYPFEYERCAIDEIGKKRAELLYKVRADKKAYKVDLKLALVGLKQELKSYE